MGEVTMNRLIPGAAMAPVRGHDAGPPKPSGESPRVLSAMEQSELSAEPGAAGKPAGAAHTVAEAAELINRALAASKRELRFSVDEASGRTLVYVMHPDTGEIVRQIPSEVVLAMAEMLDRGEQVNSLGVEHRT